MVFTIRLGIRTVFGGIFSSEIDSQTHFLTWAISKFQNFLSPCVRFCKEAYILKNFRRASRAYIPFSASGAGERARRLQTNQFGAA